MENLNNICYIGASYFGGPTMTVVASQCPEVTANVADVNPERITLWNHEDLNQLPVCESEVSRVQMFSNISHLGA